MLKLCEKDGRTEKKMGLFTVYSGAVHIELAMKAGFSSSTTHGQVAMYWNLVRCVQFS